MPSKAKFIPLLFTQLENPRPIFPGPNKIGSKLLVTLQGVHPKIFAILEINKFFFVISRNTKI